MPTCRYIHERLQQCPMQEHLLTLAQKLAADKKLATTVRKPTPDVGPLEVGCLRIVAYFLSTAVKWVAGLHTVIRCIQ